VHHAFVARRLPVGAEVVDGRGVHFRVWAPDHRRVAVVVEGRTPAERRETPMTAVAGGYFEALLEEAAGGTRYWFRLGEEEGLYPDLASRFQPEGPHGPSEVVDPGAFRWTDPAWRGIAIEGQVIYEMHVGTFTPEGTWAAAARQLPELEACGLTVLEIMPVAEFPGRFGWGYDGVDLFAPTRLYGEPDDFRRFVDEAHRIGLAVILDVVYNHVGPDGAFFRTYAKAYFSTRYENEWGDPLNFDGDDSGPVREFFVSNARYWIDEFHLDGLRFDATQTIHDASPEHVVAEMARQARKAAAERSIILVAENETQTCRLVEGRAQGGFGLDALWNDDYHHSALVALTGHREAYYTDYLGQPQEFVAAVKHGYLYQGQRYAWQKKNRGTPAWGVKPASFVSYLENHDQVANSLCGRRVHQLTSPGRYRALTALTLLGPATPMLFQGQEFASSKPFLYFADHEPALAASVRKGRFDFLSQFPSIATDAAQACLPEPGVVGTFEQCRLDFHERETHRDAYAMVRDLLRLRREDEVFRAQRPGGVDGAVIGPSAFVLRYFAAAGHHEDRLLIVNLGPDLPMHASPEPLLAPPAGRRWALGWSTDDPRYGGQGAPPVVNGDGLRLPGEAAVVLMPMP
jgi:maltooligosyltrehalose trehalohydrolase